MTREEAINIMNVIVHMLEEKYDTDRVEEAVDMAIKALEQEPCEDAISRQAVLDMVEDMTDQYGNKHSVVTEGMISLLPPVIPQPKTGHWIMPIQDDGMSDPIYYQVRCSKCGFDLDPQTWHMELHQYDADKYCPNCGAKMESEVKE